jgi:diguanylate cyclase (GGDEF)-like protein
MSSSAGEQRVDSLRKEIKAKTLAYRGKALPAITVSAGVATYPECADSDALIGAADRALYAAKHAGRDRVVLAAQAPISAEPR